MHFFAWIETTALSIWLREYPPAFPIILVLHALGMGFAAGVGVCISLRVQGVAARVPVSAFRSFLPAMWCGAVASVVSGVALLLAYPAKALTNPVFYVKFLLIGFALRLLYLQAHGPLDPARQGRVSATDRLQAALAIAAWLGAITSGRLLAYTHSVLLASDWL